MYNDDVEMKYGDIYEIEKDSPLLGMVTALKEGKTITEFEVEEDWKDDHEICLGCRVVVDGVEYRVGLLWLNFCGIRMALGAEFQDAESITSLTEFILDSATFVDDDTDEVDE